MVRPRKILKVLFVDHTSELSGGEIALLRLISSLDRHQVHPSVLLFSDGPLAEELRKRDISPIVYPLSSRLLQTRKSTSPTLSTLLVGGLSSLLFAVKLAQFLHHHSFDLIHTNSLKADVLGGLAARLAGKPLLWHIHDRIEADYLPRRTVKLFRALCRKLPHYVIANSHATLETLHLPPTKPSSVIYSGVDRSWFEEPIPLEPFCHGGPPRIGLIGRITPWKGQHIFLNAAQEFLRQGYDAEFYIIGSALFEEHEYETKIRQLAQPIADKVVFTGFQKDIKAMIGQLDILVHSSVIPEPFGQVVAEGMAAGRAVIATDGGGVKELMVNRHTGLLVPMNDAKALTDAMTYLVNHADEAKAMGRHARQRVREHFTVEQMASRLTSFYYECLS